MPGLLRSCSIAALDREPERPIAPRRSHSIAFWRSIDDCSQDRRGRGRLLLDRLEWPTERRSFPRLRPPAILSCRGPSTSFKKGVSTSPYLLRAERVYIESHAAHDAPTLGQIRKTGPRQLSRSATTFSLSAMQHTLRPQATRLRATRPARSLAGYQDRWRPHHP